MKILVLHNNYPAQFKFLLPKLISLGHEVTFISLESHGSKIPGVKHLRVSATKTEKARSLVFPYRGIGKKFANAELLRATFIRLRDSGYYPDMVIFHSGWGLGYFLKTIFPYAISACYAEWWYNWDSEELNFDLKSKFSTITSDEDQVSLYYLNSLQALELSEANYIWTPTDWQRKQFPPNLADRMEVIHEGVDTNFFNRSLEKPNTAEKIQITYSARALEPMRCFHHFFEIVANVMNMNPNISLTIVGKDQPVYRPLAKGQLPFGQIAKQKFQDLQIADRVTWFERLPTPMYKDLLVNSDIHVYFSRPFIASWSLLEAMSSGCSIFSNSHAMTNEFLFPDELETPACCFTDCTDHEKASKDLENFTNNPHLRFQTANKARKIAEKYDYRTQVKKLLKLLEIHC